ncbi:hypothetical protein DPEC_G00339270 [Dallia pectoralis]|uniref:Uncharacterized protein n=1 Tax=Dallia pectoralis TaxID=75939 RepID=A0ACC2F4R6_DALPE|nr:hypothetical protein DPEC_G00339270 [Dallia pectoralis]
MFDSYIENIKNAHGRQVSQVNSATTLKDICLKAVSNHVEVLEKKALDLPVSLIKELLPHLNIVDLDRIHTAVNLRGISTSFVWAGILREISGPRKECTRLTEDEWREKTMSKLFKNAFYGLRFRGDTKYLLNVDFHTLLLAMAKYVQLLPVFRTPPHCRFTQQTDVLSILEKNVRSVKVEVNGELRVVPGGILYALHRLLDHGAVRNVILDHTPDPRLLAWILHGRGPQSASQQCPLQSIHGEMRPDESAGTTAACWGPEDTEPDDTQRKRPRLSIAPAKEQPDPDSRPCHCLEPKPLCQMLVPSATSSKESCPKGQIHSLVIKFFTDGILPVLFPLLPSWLCLRSLSLHGAWTFEEGDVLRLAECLQKLSEQGGCSLTELSVGSLPHAGLMESLLNACPALRSISVEIQFFPEYDRPPVRGTRQSTHQTELSLEKLCVNLPNMRTSLESLLSVLNRSPHLTSLHVSGNRCEFSSRHLIHTVAESNRKLRELALEGINLSNCHSAFFQLLHDNCTLEALSLKDCNFLEKCSDKEDAVRQLVNSIKKLPTLQSLSLVENRLAKNVIVLGELFMEPSPSALKELDISSNFIKPSELLELGRLLGTHRPPQRLLIGLKNNPLDRDLVLRDTALAILGHVCDLITDYWNSRDTMADYVSFM